MQSGMLFASLPAEVASSSIITAKTSGSVTIHEPSGIDVVNGQADSNNDAPSMSISGFISLVGELVKGALPDSPYNPSPAPGLFTANLPVSAIGSGAVFGNYQSDASRVSGRTSFFSP